MRHTFRSSLSLSRLNRRRFLQYGGLAVGSGLAAACTRIPNADNRTGDTSPSADGLEKLVFGTNWVAEAEHGGFYQAVATGLYREAGLDVTIKMGGPQLPSGTQLLMGGAVDLFMGYGIDAIKAVEEGIPKITVAALFQKDPQCLIAHPNTGVETLDDLKGKPIYVSTSANATYWPVLRAKYGFTDDQKRPYNFNPGPFLADKTVAQQGYVTSEPFVIEKQGKFKPVVLLLADGGYTPYSTTIEAKTELVEQNPELVQRFVDASIKGWYSYLEDPTPGNQLIKQANPEMSDEHLAFSLQKMKDYAMVLGPDALRLGIGAMTEERWKTFFDEMVAVGIFKPETDYRKAYTLKFVNRGPEYYKA